MLRQIMQAYRLQCSKGLLYKMRYPEWAVQTFADIGTRSGLLPHEVARALAIGVIVGGLATQAPADVPYPLN